MKFSLDGFKKISKDGNTTTLQHPSGHEMTINHSVLSPKMRGEIEALPNTEDKERTKLSEGGQVPTKDENKLSDEEKQEYDENMKSFAKKQAPVESDRKPASKDQEYADGGDVKESPEAADKRVLEQNVAEEKSKEDKAAAEVARSESAIQEESKDQPQQILEKVNNPQNNINDILASHKNLTDSHNAIVQAFAKNQPAQDEPQTAPQPTQQPSQQMVMPVTPEDKSAAGLPTNTQPQQDTQPSVQQPQQNSTNVSTPTPNGYQQNIDSAQKHINDLDQYTAQQSQKNQELFNQVSQGKIDPKQYFQNQDTVGKITNVIGLIMGGLGASSTGGKNLAVDALNHLVTQDVDAQKANLEKGMNLYKLNLEATHNEQEARSMTINQQLTMAQAALTKQAAGINNAATLANIQKTNEEIDQLKVQNAQKQYLFKALQGDSSGGSTNSESTFQNRLNTIRMLNPDLGKDMESKYMPGVGVASIPVPEKQRDKILASTTLAKKLAELENFSRDNSGTLFDPAVKAKGHALANDVISSYRIATDQGVFKPSDQAFLEKSLPTDPTAFFAKYRTIPAYNEVRRLINESNAQTQKAYGVKPFDQDHSGVPEGTRAKTKDGSPVIRMNGQWVKQ